MSEGPYLSLWPQGHPCLSKNLKTGDWICGECKVVFVIDEMREPVNGMPFFTGTADNRICKAPLMERLLYRHLREIRWLFGLSLQCLRIHLYRIAWALFGDGFSSGCPVCRGTGKLHAAYVHDPETGEAHRQAVEPYPCHYCNSVSG